MEVLKKSFGFDYRSLALYRLLIGLVVMADVLYRLPDLANHYTDTGLIPRAIFLTEMSMPWSASFHLINGSTGFMGLLFGIHFLCGLCLMLGYKTRWATFGAWVFTVSLHNRNWVINNGGDDILRSILLISIFLPLNKCFSLDSALTRPKELLTKTYELSTWTLTFYLQMFAVYFVSYVLKDSPIWRSEFTAINLASRLDIFATPLGIWSRNFPLFQKVSTFFTAYLEWGGPLLLIFGAAFGRRWWKVRLIVIALFWSLHIGIILTMMIGVFPYMCLGIWTIFIPGEAWDRLKERFLRKGLDRLSIYYDEECLFCQKTVLILREFFLLPEVVVAPAQSRPEILKTMQENHSWVVAKNEQLTHWGAMTEVFRHSPILQFVAPVFTLEFMVKLFNRIYVWVSRHRPLMGKVTQFLEFRAPKKKIVTFWVLGQLAGAFLFTTILMWNLTTIKKLNFKAPFFQSVGRWVHVYQEWNMFAPFPKMENVWIEIPAVLGDGSEIELLTGSRDIYSVKDKAFVKAVANEHWRKFYLNLSDKVDYARYFGGYLCRKWNTLKQGLVKNQTLRKFEIIAYSQINLIEGGKGPINKKLTWKHWCFDEDMKRETAK